MSRYIDADALKKDLTRFYDNEVTAKELIDEQPTADVKPVKRKKHKMKIEKAIKAAKRLKKYCASFDACCTGCIFRDTDKYTKSGCMLREGVPPEEYDNITESEGGYK